MNSVFVWTLDDVVGVGVLVFILGYGVTAALAEFISSIIKRAKKK